VHDNSAYRTIGAMGKGRVEKPAGTPLTIAMDSSFSASGITREYDLLIAYEAASSEAPQRAMMMSSVLCVADQDAPSFETSCLLIDVVCAGDSITGWNNYGSMPDWPYRTYPEFLQQLCQPAGLRVANGGIAGEISQNGLGQVQEYLELFPNARYFIIGYGTNDLGIWPQVEQTSRLIIENLDLMVQAIRTGGRKPVLLNVPYVNRLMFPGPLAENLSRQRDYHNARLREYCLGYHIPLAEICSKMLDEHFADELHPSDGGAKIIAAEVFKVLTEVQDLEGPNSVRQKR
jgi:lysophospholipase L1-like esterase